MVIGFLFLFLIAISCNTNKEEIVITADDLIDEFRINENISKKKYKGTILHVTGKVIRIEQPKDFKPLWEGGSCVIIGAAGGEEWSIRCYFNSRLAVNNIAENDIITVMGTLTTVDRLLEDWVEIILKSSIILSGNAKVFPTP
jgi:hypothetical protein